MYTKKLFITLALFFAIAAPVQAQELTPALRLSLLHQLQTLLQELVSLQAQLAKEDYAASVLIHPQGNLYPTDFYDGKYEAVYSVQSLELTPILTAGVRAGDKALFTTFMNLAGDSFTETHVEEFRIFNDDNNQLGAYVQQKMDGSWILAVNRFDEDLLITHDEEGMVDLLLHEYAHILFFEGKTMADDFEKKFWGTALMKEHAQKTGGITDVNTRIRENSAFYKKYKSMFVTEYAATTLDEDIVESFTFFVTKNKPEQNSIADQKILFFYKDASMIKLRDQLRNSAVLNF